MNMVILKGSTMRNFYKNIWQKARNHLTSNATTETTKSPKNMVDTVLDSPRCPFSNPLTLKRLKIKEKKFPLFEVFFRWKNHIFSGFWSSKFKVTNFTLSHRKMKITMKGSVFWKSIFKTYILWYLNIRNHKIHIDKTTSKKLKIFIFQFFFEKQFHQNFKKNEVVN